MDDKYNGLSMPQISQSTQPWPYDIKAKKNPNMNHVWADNKQTPTGQPAQIPSFQVQGEQIVSGYAVWHF